MHPTWFILFYKCFLHRYALVKRWETRVFWWIPNCYLPPRAPKSRNLSLVYLYCYQAFIFLQPAWYAASAFRGRIYGPKIILFYAGSRCRKKSKTNWLLVLAPIVLRWPSLTQGRFGFWAFLRAKSNESKRPLLMPIRSLMITLCCSLVRNGWMRSTRLAVLLCHILRVCGRTELLPDQPNRFASSRERIRRRDHHEEVSGLWVTPKKTRTVIGLFRAVKYCALAVCAFLITIVERHPSNCATN